MKKLLTVFVAALLLLALCVNVFAEDEIEIPLDADHVGASSAGGADVLTIADGTITATEEAAIPLFALNLPENVKLGDTITVHIKGTSDGDFRVWLLADSETEEKGAEATFSNQWKASENGYTAPGEFEKYIELTAEDYDAQGGTEANRIAFKGPSYGVNLTNLKLTYVGVVTGGMASVEGNASEDAQPFLDAANAALEAAKSATDAAGVQAALDDANAAVASLEEAASLGFTGVNDMLKQAQDVVKEIEALISSADAEAVLADLQGDIDALASAKDAAASAASAGEIDVDAAQAALDSAKTALANIEAVAKANPSYSNVTEALKNARADVKEIEASVTAAEEAARLAEEEAARLAEEEAAAKKRTTTTIIIAVVVVVVVIIAVVCIVMAMKKKKKG